MVDILSIHEKYSTTRLATKEKPDLASNPEDKLKSVLFLPKNEERQGEGGLRTHGYFKQSYKDKPLIAVVTVVFNGEKHLEQTILSVINQTYDNVEYIIIDGGSSDGTLDIIRKYEHAIDYWVSERDGGIYDAMNRAASLATAEWINFMNTGDKFHNKEVVSYLFNSTNLSDSAVVYGNVINVYDESHKVLKQADPINLYYKGMPFSHQSSFVKISLMKQFGFDMKHKFCADYNFLYSLYINGCQFYSSGIVVADFDMNGLSTNYLNVFQEKKEIVRKLEPDKVFFYNIRRFMWLKMKEGIKALLPKEFVNGIRKKLSTLYVLMSPKLSIQSDKID